MFYLLTLKIFFFSLKSMDFAREVPIFKPKNKFVAREVPIKPNYQKQISKVLGAFQDFL